ncbi:MAG: ABC transporter substrate-binding protein [Elusimicrobia bacterium]|nr:ABC transporter substrate-binding protein [Elusimicrobiota bacterium]
MSKSFAPLQKRLAVLLLGAGLLTGCSRDKLRIGYAVDDGVIVWGEVGQIFERTNILEKNGIEAEIKRYKTTRDILPAIFRNEIDVALTATGVALCSIIADQPVKIAALLGGGGRNALIVSEKSGIRSVAALKGKTVFDPIVGALLFRFLKDAGLKPGEVTRLTGYRYGADINDELLSGGVDAVMSWDPFFLELEKRKKIRVLAHDPYHLQALIRSGVAGLRRKAALNFAVSLKEAVFFMLTHQELANRWYAEVSGIPAGRIAEALVHCELHNETKDIASIGGFSLLGNDSKLRDIQNVADAMRDYKVIAELKETFSSRFGAPIRNDYDTKGVNVRAFLDFELNEATDKKLAGYDPATVKYK